MSQLEFWAWFLPQAASKTPRFASVAPTTSHFVSANSIVRGILFRYVVRAQSAGVELSISRNAAWNEQVFKVLVQGRSAIEAAYGGPLDWHDLNRSGDPMDERYVDDRSIEGGHQSPRTDWPDTAASLIASMQRLDSAMSPHLAALLTDFGMG